MNELLLILAGGVVVLVVEYAVVKPWLNRWRRFSRYEKTILQSMAFLECERIGEGAEAKIRFGSDAYEDWEHLAAFESLLAEGYVEKQSGENQYGLSARGQIIAVRMFERGLPFNAFAVVTKA